VPDPQDVQRCDEEPLANLVDTVATTLGPVRTSDYNLVLAALKADAETHKRQLPAKRLSLLQMGLAQTDESAKPVIRKYTAEQGQAGAAMGLLRIGDGRKARVWSSTKPDTDLRDTEQVLCGKWRD